MQDHLKDLVQHTYALGNIDLIKITGSSEETLINSISEDRSVILEAKFKSAHPDFIGTYGMPNLGKLKTILGIDEYRENAKITVNTQTDTEGKVVPSGIHFENAAGDFKNDYRYMTEGVINDKIKAVKFKGVAWNVEFEPSIAGIMRLKKQASANSEEKNFTTKTENGDLKIFFGDHSSHAGNFTFAPATGGSLSKQLNWPVAVVNSIFSLPGDKTFKISDEGVAEITVDSGLAVYHYKLPAQSK